VNHDLAVNGREAVTKWAELRPDIVLMDVSMPELNGLEATAEIRAIEARDGFGADADCRGDSSYAEGR
jgi:CheY-like chemotaxis protein